MAGERYQVLGWREKRATEHDCWRCPGCSHLSYFLSGFGTGVFCVSCGTISPSERWKPAKQLGTVVVCGGCGAEVPLIPSTVWDSGFHVCDCYNVVAIPQGEDFVDPRAVLDLEWNSDIRSRAEAFEAGWFAVSRILQDRTVARLLQVLAKNDEGAFLYGNDNDHNIGLYFDANGYFGYVMWTHKTIPVLRQIFVVKERQRMGLGTQMIRYWAERFAFPHVEKFGVEDPNEKSMGVLLKLGYVRRGIAGTLIGVRLKFIPWGFE